MRLIFLFAVTNYSPGLSSGSVPYCRLLQDIFGLPLGPNFVDRDGGSFYGILIYCRWWAQCMLCCFRAYFAGNKVCI